MAESDQARDKSRPTAESLWMELRSKRQTKCHYRQPACATLKLFILFIYFKEKSSFWSMKVLTCFFSSGTSPPFIILLYFVLVCIHYSTRIKRDVFASKYQQKYKSQKCMNWRGFRQCFMKKRGKNIHHIDRGSDKTCFRTQDETMELKSFQHLFTVCYSLAEQRWR